MESKEIDALVGLFNTGHAIESGVAQADAADAYARLMKVHRKVNANADSDVFKRYELMLAECQKRGVRFLPAQVMRPIFRAAGL